MAVHLHVPQEHRHLALERQLVDGRALRPLAEGGEGLRVVVDVIPMKFSVVGLARIDIGVLEEPGDWFCIRNTYLG